MLLKMLEKVVLKMRILFQKSKTLFVVLWSLFNLAIVFACSDMANAEEFKTGAKQAILMDFNSGAVLFEKDSESRMGPSSMTKIMTAYIIFDSLKSGDFSLDSKFHVSEKAWRKGGSKMFVNNGSYVRLEELLKGIIVQSGNDACIVFAEGHSKTESAFAEDMNYMAERLGLLGSNFVNATGWPDKDHYSTAKDIATLSRRVIQDFPEYYKYFGIKEFEYNGIKQRNRNGLLNKEGLGVDGLKTGHTDAAGYGIAVSAVQNGKRLIAVVNGLNSERRRLSEAERLLRHGFLDYKTVKLYDKYEIIDKVRVWQGKEAYVPIYSSKEVQLIINRIKQERPDYKIEVAYKEPWVAPIKKDTNMATLVIKRDGNIVSQYPLYASKDVEEAGYFRKIYDKILHFVGI